MRAAIIEDKRKIAIREVPDPIPDDDEVLIRVQYCGICGSDLHVYEEGAGISTGHEFSGDIVAVGSGIKEWMVGDRVTVTGYASEHMDIFGRSSYNIEVVSLVPAQ